MPQPRFLSGLPWTRAVRLKVDRGKPFAPPASGAWYAPARSPARQRRGSGRFHYAPGGVRVSRGFPLCVTGAPAVRRAAIPAPGCPLSRDTRSILSAAIPRCPLSRHTRFISGCSLSRYPLCLGMSSMSGFPLYSGVSAIPRYPLSRSVPYFGILAPFRAALSMPLHPGVPLRARARCFPCKTTPG